MLAELTETTTETVPLCPIVSGDLICPMTGTTECTTSEAEQRRCPSC